MNFYFPCKWKKLINALKKLGLDLREGGNHTRAECVHNGRKTTIPRHNEIKSDIVKSIRDFLLEKDFKDEEIIKLLK